MTTQDHRGDFPQDTLGEPRDSTTHAADPAFDSTPTPQQPYDTAPEARPSTDDSAPAEQSYESSPAADRSYEDRSYEAAPAAADSMRGTQPSSSETPAGGSAAAGSPQHSETGAGPDGDALFSSENSSRFRGRWDQVQAAFVDDPRDCVQNADGLVSEVVEQLTSGFAEARSRLEAQWSRGEEASTEELRLTLKRYREFFDRLLSV